MATLLLTVEQAAEALALSRTVIYELMGAGKLDSVHIGRARRITQASLEEYVSRLQTAQQTGDAA